MADKFIEPTETFYKIRNQVSYLEAHFDACSDNNSPAGEDQYAKALNEIQSILDEARDLTLEDLKEAFEAIQR